MYSLLYIDDEPALLEIGRLFLERTGDFTVTCAGSGQEALEKLAGSHFDAIVSDYQMQGMDGIELLKAVRNSYGKIPFILFTGKGREEVVIAAINNGADFYIQKGGEPKAQFAELAHKLRQAITRVQAENALLESEKRLTDIINFLPDATMAIDTKGTVIAWNRAMEKITGRSAADILGKDNHEYSLVFYGERRPMLIDLVLSPDEKFETGHYLYTRRTATNLTAETVLEREGRPRVNLWGIASCLFDANGTLIGAIESIRDITHLIESESELRAANEQLAASAEELRSQYDELAGNEKKLQESEEKYRTLVEHSQDGIFIAQDGHLVFHNRGFREILGYAKGELNGVPLERCLAPEDRDMVLARHFSRLSGDQLPEVYECSFLMRDGTTRRRVKMDVGLASYRGKPATIGTIHDVTDERLREEKLRDSEMHYRTLVENLQDVVYQTDREGRLTMISPSGVALLGYDSPEELIGKNIEESLYLVPEKRKVFHDALLRDGLVKDFEVELRHKQGTPVTVSTSSHLYYDKDGTVLGIEGIFHDITAQKKALEERDRRRDQLEEISASVPGVVYQFYVTPDGTWGESFLSGQVQDILGAPAKVVNMQPWFVEHVHPDDRARFAASIETALKNRENWQFEGRFIKPSGEVMWFQGNANLIPHEDKLVYSGVLMDITKRRLAEEALRESEEQFRNIFENSPLGMALSTPDLRFVLVNPAMASMTGYTKGELQKISFKDITHPDYLESDLEQVQELAAGAIPVYCTEKRYIRKDGSILWGLLKLTAIRDQQGTLHYFVAQVEDITERKKAEEALRKSEMKYRMLVENSHDIIYSISPGGVITFVSPVWTTLLGHPVSDVINKPFRTFIHPQDIQRYEALLAEVVKTGNAQAGIEYRVYHADGSIRLHSSNISPVFDEQGTLVFSIGTAQDITDVRQSEQGAKEANRKLGLLNSITRHDMNNQLTIVLGYAQLAALEKPDPTIAGYLVKMETALTVIQRQIEFMKTYQDLGVIAPAWHRIDDLVRSARPDDLSITSTCQDVMIFADPMIGKVFSNLFDNALRHGKTVTHVDVRCEAGAENLVLTVEDNGIGVPIDEKMNIFEKGYGQNTGFGLFLTREILAITGISIRETGTPGKGARFEIIVPKEAYRNT
ncbi:MAG: PAS domain S-box protein [Methanoregula sp.]